LGNGRRAANSPKSSCGSPDQDDAMNRSILLRVYPVPGDLLIPQVRLCRQHNYGVYIYTHLANNRSLVGDGKPDSRTETDSISFRYYFFLSERLCCYFFREKKI
jgi:hypothetical protein